MNKALIFCLFLVFSPSVSNAAEPVKATSITAEELNKMIEDEADFMLIDARPKDKFATGHIKNAINLPANEVNSQTLAKISEDMDEKLVFYCADSACSSSNIASAKAIGAGYRYVYKYSGGWAGWLEHGYAAAK